jgi:hypothetical protein
MFLWYFRESTFFGGVIFVGELYIIMIGLHDARKTMSTKCVRFF